VAIPGQHRWDASLSVPDAWDAWGGARLAAAADAALQLQELVDVDAERSAVQARGDPAQDATLQGLQCFQLTQRV
jgi:hypothetical protein